MGTLAAGLVAVLLCVVPVAARVSPEGAGKGPGSAGILRGIVEVGPELTARRIRLSLYPDVSGAAPAPARFSAADELRNVVVSVESSPGLLAAAGSAPAGPALRVEQRDETFMPHVVTVLKGTDVEFVNLDPIFHNVFSLSRAASFDLGRFPRGTSRTVRFDRPGMVRVFCHIHPDMSAVVVVRDNPFYTVPDSTGQFEISGLPPGEHTVEAWHERARPIRRTVRIEAGRVTEVRFVIPLRDTPVGE